jgi:hypothetical protein
MGVKMITRGVMKTFDLKDATFYEVSCDCGVHECNMTLELEYAPEFDEIFMNFYKRVAISVYWNDANFLTRIWRRIKYCLQIIFTGKIELTETHIFRDIEHIDAFIEAMKEGKEKMLNERIPQNTNSFS